MFLLFIGLHKMNKIISVYKSIISDEVCVHSPAVSAWIIRLHIHFLLPPRLLPLLILLHLLDLVDLHPLDVLFTHNGDGIKTESCLEPMHTSENGPRLFLKLFYSFFTIFHFSSFGRGKGKISLDLEEDTRKPNVSYQINIITVFSSEPEDRWR